MLLPLAISPTVLIITLFIVLITLLLQIVALVDILGNEFKEGDKLIWVVLVIFASLLGCILYFTMGQQQKLPKS